MVSVLNMIFRTLRNVDPKGIFLALTALSAILLTYRGQNEAQKMTGLLSLLLAAVFFFPPAASFLSRFMRDGVTYWRFLWTIPAVQLMACIGTEAFTKPRRKVGRVAALVAVCALFAVAGQCVYQRSTFSIAQNREKFDPIVIRTANLINSNAEQTDNPYKKVMAPQMVRSEIRQVDATILSAIGRDFLLAHPDRIDPNDGYGYMLLLLEGTIPDSQKKIYQFMEQFHCNYLLIRTDSQTEETLSSQEGTRLIYREDGWDVWYADKIRGAA